MLTPFLFRCAVFLGMFFVTCPPRKVHGLEEDDVGPFATCAGGCHCDNVESQPVCSMDGATIFKSPCHAGCSSSNRSVELDSKGKPKTVYWGCGCARLKSLSLGRFFSEIVAFGPCFFFLIIF